MKNIEFLGMPKAGKSTQIELVENVLKHDKKLRVRNIYEGARICPLDKEDRLLYNSWSFHNTANRIMEAQNDDYDFILIDRGVYDHIAFTLALHRSGLLTKKEYEAQTDYFSQFESLEDSAIVLMISPEESMKRENKYHSFRGRVMNESFLSALHRAYEDVIPNIKKEYIVIDASKDLKENGNEILEVLGYRDHATMKPI